MTGNSKAETRPCTPTPQPAIAVVATVEEIPDSRACIAHD